MQSRRRLKERRNFGPSFREIQTALRTDQTRQPTSLALFACLSKSFLKYR